MYISQRKAAENVSDVPWADNAIKTAVKTDNKEAALFKGRPFMLCDYCAESVFVLNWWRGI